jgi:hypothetical protein
MGLLLALSLNPTSQQIRVVLPLGRGLSFYVVPGREHRIAPRVIAALAGFVHDRQSAADSEHNHDKNN